MLFQIPSWLNQAKFVSPVMIEVGFVIRESLYSDPENGLTQEQLRSSQDRLYQPAVRKYGHFALSSDITGQESELVRYYRDVIAKADRHGEVTKEGSYHFWNRPVIYSPDGFTFGFPWYDRLIEGRRLFDAIFSSKCDGEVFWDMDQGWELVFWLQDEMLYASESDPDDETTRQSFKFDYQPIRLQIAELVPRVERIISIFSNELGTDYWS